MNKPILIENQTQLDALCQSINWDEAFIRETYLVSPTYKSEDSLSLIAFGSAPDIRILVITPHDKYIQGIELILQGVDHISIEFRIGFRLSGKVNFHNTNVELNFAETQRTINAESVFYILHNTEINGWKLRYGRENPFSEEGHRPF